MNKRVWQSVARTVATFVIGSVIATSTAYMVLDQSASATNLKNLVRDVVTKQAKKYLGTGQTVDQATVQNNINAGLANLDSKITSERAANALNASEYAQLQSEVSAIRATSTTFLADGKYTNDEINQVLAAMQKFNELHARVLANHVPDSPVHPALATQAKSASTIWTKVSGLQSTISSRINAGLSDGTLTTKEAAQFKSELNTIYDQLKATRSSLKADLSSNSLYQKLRDLNKRVAQLSASRFN